MKSAIVFGAIALGFALLVASSVWSSLFPATSSWTPEKAARISDVKAQLNDLSGKLYAARNRTHGGPDPGLMKAEHDKLLEEHEQLKIDFETATDRPQTMSKVLKWTGISLAAIGIIGWYSVKNNS